MICHKDFKMTLRQAYEIQLKAISNKSAEYINNLNNRELLTLLQIRLNLSNCIPLTNDDYFKQLEKLENEIL